MALQPGPDQQHGDSNNLGKNRRRTSAGGPLRAPGSYCGSGASIQQQQPKEMKKQQENIIVTAFGVAFTGLFMGYTLWALFSN